MSELTGPRVLNLVQFAQEIGGVTSYDVESHIHGALRSKPAAKTFQRWFDRRLAELQAARDRTVALYRAEVAAGRIIEPRRTLEDIASGHPDNPSVQAARRLLEKKRLRSHAE